MLFSKLLKQIPLAVRPRPPIFPPPAQYWRPVSGLLTCLLRGAEKQSLKDAVNFLN